MSYAQETIDYKGCRINIECDDMAPEGPRSMCDTTGSMAFKDLATGYMGGKDEDQVDTEEWIPRKAYENADAPLQEKMDFFGPDGDAYAHGVWSPDGIEATYSRLLDEAIAQLQKVMLWAPMCMCSAGSQSIYALGSWYDTAEDNSRYDDGYLYITLTKAINEWGNDSTTCWRDEVRYGGESMPLYKAAKQYLKAEADEFFSWCNGEVYGYTCHTLDEDGEEEDEIEDGSCWGYYSYDFEANGLLESARSAIDCHLGEVEQVRVKWVRAHFRRLKAYLKYKVPLHKREPYDNRMIQVKYT